jgi:T4 RnlA family RNA ligase
MINKHPDKDLYLVKYIHLGIDWSIEGALDARGLILDSSGNVIARPYKKFFNYKELEGRDDLPEHIRQLSEWEDGEYEVQEKVDGSLIMVFGYQDELVFASSGSFISEHAELAKELFEKQFNDEQKSRIRKAIFVRNTCFLFELVSPRYQIVIHYDDERLILHDVIENENGKFSVRSTRFFANALEIPMVKKYDFSKEELEKAQTELKDVEGFVVKFKSGKMLKIKTEDYFEKSKDVAIFFGRFFTYRKIGIVIDAIFSDTYDDLVASAVSHPKIKENIEEIFSLYQNFETDLLRFKKKWITGEFHDRKLIATSPETKDNMHMIFLAQKERNHWKEPFRQVAFKKFIKEV